MNEITKLVVNRNDVIIDLKKIDVPKGKTKGSSYFAPAFEIGDAEITPFLGQDDVNKLLLQATRNLGREIHKDIVGSNPEIVIGSDEYVEEYQNRLDGWEATAETKADLQLEEERLGQLGQQLAIQAMATGATRIVHSFTSAIEKGKTVDIDFDIPQLDGLSAKDSALEALKQIVTESNDIRRKIQEKARTRSPNKPKTPAVVAPVTATPEATATEQSVATA